MARKNRKCASCGTTYSYCPSCSGADKLAPTWKSEFCSEICKDVWSTCTQYNLNLVTKEKAQEMLEQLDMNTPDSYVETIQRDIIKITSRQAIEHEVVKTEKEN